MIPFSTMNTQNRISVFPRLTTIPLIASGESDTPVSRNGSSWK
jgi:hypothetical protein